MNEENITNDLISQLQEAQLWVDELYDTNKPKIEQSINENIVRLTKEHGFDDRYALPNGLFFTYKMFNDLCIYYDFIEDLHRKYGTKSILGLRKKLNV